MFTPTRNKIKNLSPLQKLLLQEHYQHWLAIGKSTQPIDRLQLEQAISSAYARIGLVPPAFMWCQSPWQMIAMPALVEFAHSYERRLNCKPLPALLEERLCRRLVDSYPWQQLVTNYLDHHSPELHRRLQRQRSRKQEAEARQHLLSLLPPRKESSFLHESKNTSILGFALTTLLGSQLANHWAPTIDEVCQQSLSKDIWSQIAQGLSEKLENELNRPYIGHLRFDLQTHAVFSIEETLNVAIGPIIRSAYRPIDVEAISAWSSGRNWLSEYVFIADVIGCPWLEELLADQLSDYLTIAREGFAYVPYENVCFLSERPLSLATDENGSLHHESGPAITFCDGFCLYSWHGVRVPEEVIRHPERITIEHIEDERNTELRRVLIDRFGLARFIQESGCEKIHEDDFGVLYKRKTPSDEPLLLVKVVNSTAELDGTYKDYLLRVPPDMKTARQAVAWTFDMQSDEYSPDLET